LTSLKADISTPPKMVRKSHYMLQQFLQETVTSERRAENALREFLPTLGERAHAGARSVFSISDDGKQTAINQAASETRNPMPRPAESSRKKRKSKI